MPEVPHAGEHHGDAALVGCGDDLGVALAAAGLDHGAGARVDDRIEAVAKRAGVGMDRVYVNVQRYGNMSAATVPVALVEALEEGRVPPGGLLLMPSFGAGLTWCAHLVRWGSRVTPKS